jgi:hypothetical protein
LLSAAIRIGYYLEAREGPLLASYLWSESDMSFFDRWGKAIIHSDALGRHAMHPYFQWQDGPAAAYFAANPSKIPQYETAGVTRGDRAALYRALWDNWTHGNEFYQEPLYVYLVALTYRLFGESPGAVYAWQLLLGIATNILVYFLAEKYFGQVAGVIAGVLFALYSPLFLYDLTLLRTTLTAFLAAVVVVLLEWSRAGEDQRRWAVFGFAVGIAMACQSTFLAFLIGSAALAWFANRTNPKRALQSVLMIIVGVSLAVCPIIVRNIAVGAPTFGWAGAGVWTFVRFNTPSADPLLGAVAPTNPDHIRVLTTTDAVAAPAVLATIREHTPRTLARLEWLKFSKVWHWFEEPDNVDFYYSQLWSKALRLSPVTNSLIAPLLLVAIFVFIKEWWRLAPLYLLAANGILSLMVTYPTGRYRVQYFAVLIPLVAGVLVKLWDWVRAQEYSKLSVIGVVLAAVIWWTWAPIPRGRPLIRDTYYIAPIWYYWRPLRDAAVQRGDWREAARLVSQAAESEPPNLVARGESQLVQVYIGVHVTLASDLEKAGDTAGAASELQHAEQLAATLRR